MLAVLLWTLAHDTTFDVHTIQVEGYKVIWQRVDDGESNSWCELRDPNGRVVVRLEDYYCAPLGLHETEPMATVDVDGDGTKEIVLQTWSGAVHGGMTYQIWALGDRPKCLVAWDKNNVRDEYDFTLEDIDDDGLLEVLTWYDGFAYSIAGAYSGQVPIVLKLHRGRYVDQTLKFPAVADRIWRTICFEGDVFAAVEEAKHDPDGQPSVCEKDAILNAWVYLWTQSGKYGPAMLSSKCSEAGREWLSANKREMRECLEFRKERISYAEPYQTSAFRWVPKQSRYFVLNEM